LNYGRKANVQPPDSLEIALTECHRLREENRRLRELLAQHKIEIPGSSSGTSKQTVSEQQRSSALLSQESSAKEKIALFRSLFRGREDVYAVRWESRDGRSGYSPACVKDWDAIRDVKPAERKKIERKTRTLLPLTDEVIRDHLSGKHTIGVYPLLADDTCCFLAMDFDKKSWEKDSTHSLLCVTELACLLRWSGLGLGKAVTSGFSSTSLSRRPSQETWVRLC
jgi:hypothetical protein